MSRHPAIRTPAERAARVAACTCIALLVAWAPQVRADADGVWSDVASPPSYREGPAVYDAQNDRLVVFGPPEPLNGYPVNPPLVAQPMALSLSDHTWTPLQTTNHPGCPSLPLFIVDEAHDRFVRWGGAGATTDTWVLSRATLDWSNLSPSGPPPSARSGATAIYDPVRHRMLLFGGGATTATFGHEVWALSLDDPPAWSQLAPTGTPPPDRGWHSAIYDPVGDRMVIFGGAKPVSGSLNDVWALSLAGTPTWSMITPAGTPPPTLSRSAVAYDPDGHRMFVHNFQTLWALTLSGTPTWSQIVSTGTTQPMLNHAGAWDTTRHRLLVAGGYIISGTYEMPVWSFDPAGSEWRRLNLGVPPHDDCMNVAVLDPVRDRMIVAGNKDSNLFPPKPWVSALQFNDPPPGWIGFDADFYNSAGMTYDPVGDRWIAFGGSVAGGVLIQEMLEILPSGTSAVLVGTGGPPPDRKNPGMVYDPVRQRVLVLGGQGNSGYPNDAWELVLSDPPAWTEILATGTPAAPALGAAIYDAVNDRVLMGADPLLALDLASNTWSEVATIGTPHDGPRAYDPVRNRLLFFPNPDSVWALSLSGTPTWSALAPTGPAPPPQIQSLAVYDPRRDRVVVTSWNTSAPSYNHYDATTWALTFGEPARILRSRPATRRSRVLLGVGSDGSHDRPRDQHARRPPRRRVGGGVRAGLARHADSRAHGRGWGRGRELLLRCGRARHGGGRNELLHLQDLVLGRNGIRGRMRLRDRGGPRVGGLGADGVRDPRRQPDARRAALRGRASRRGARDARGVRRRRSAGGDAGGRGPGARDRRVRRRRPRGARGLRRPAFVRRPNGDDARRRHPLERPLSLQPETGYIGTP